MHAKLNELITNLNAHVRIWMLEKTLPGTVANLNALDAYLNLNDVNAKFLDRSANLNARITNLNYGFHGPDLFREFEWLLHQIEWQICEIDRENLYYSNIVYKPVLFSTQPWQASICALHPSQGNIIILNRKRRVSLLFYKGLLTKNNMNKASRLAIGLSLHRNIVRWLNVDH